MKDDSYLKEIGVRKNKIKQVKSSLGKKRLASFKKSYETDMAEAKKSRGGKGGTAGALAVGAAGMGALSLAGRKYESKYGSSRENEVKQMSKDAVRTLSQNDGKWITVRGRRIFVKKGQKLNFKK